MNNRDFSRGGFRSSGRSSLTFGYSRCYPLKKTAMVTPCDPSDRPPVTPGDIYSVLSANVSCSRRCGDGKQPFSRIATNAVRLYARVCTY